VYKIVLFECSQKIPEILGVKGAKNCHLGELTNIIDFCVIYYNGKI